jgi:N-acetylmuramoyl-L-alanine amidase
VTVATLSPDKVRFIAVHCSASPPSVYVDRDVIDRWHRARGFLSIGYHFVIKRDGTVQAGRAVDQIGAHVEGHNHESVGVCLAGGVDEKGKSVNNFTPEQMNALRALVAGLSTKFPDATVQGHRDFPNVAKDCPCFDVKPWWSKAKGTA